MTTVLVKSLGLWLTKQFSGLQWRAVSIPSNHTLKVNFILYTSESCFIHEVNFVFHELLLLFQVLHYLT